MLTFIQDSWDTITSIPYLTTVLAGLYVVYLVWMVCLIVLEKREPVATLSWILCLAALPYIGLFVYYLLGPQKIRRQNVRRGRHRDDMSSYRAVCPVDENASELAKVAQATTGLPPSTASALDWLVDGGTTYAAILRDVAKATDHVHVLYYIFMPDRSGTALRDALIERARAGVQVKLMIDAIGSSKVRKAFLKPLLDAGAEVVWFHPSQLLRPFKRPWMNLRTHRKLVIIDGKVAFTGGINITDEQDERLREDAYRDLHMRLEGAVVRSLQLVFVEDWLYASGQSRDVFQRERLWPEGSPCQTHGDIQAQVLISGPDSGWETIHRLHVAAIQEARRRVWLVTPYFVPGEAARMALTSAALGGLDTRLLVPKQSDSTLVTLAARSYFDELLKAGVRVYEYGPRMLHTKAFIADDHLSIVGSANFDHRSFRLNFELSLMIRDKAVTAELSALLEDEFAKASEVTMQRERSLWRHRLPEGFARLASPLL